MRPAITFLNIQLSNSRVLISSFLTATCLMEQDFHFVL